MEEWGLDPKKDLDKIARIPFGGFIQKKDAPLMHESFARHHRELQAAIDADPTGEGFIKDMFFQRAGKSRVQLHRLGGRDFGLPGPFL